MAINYVTLTGHFGDSAAGIQAIFTPTNWLQSSGTSQTFPPAPVTAVADGNGNWSASLLATDSSATPNGWSWSVEFIGISGVAALTQNFFLLHASGATQDWSSIAVNGSVPNVSPYVLESQLGVDNGVATLDGTGNVPLGQLGNAPGGGNSVTSVFTRTGAVAAQSGDYTAAQVGAVPTTAVGAASGVASLDANGLIPFAQMSDYLSGQQLASGETCIPRLIVANTPYPTSQKLQLTYWTATKTEVCHNIIANTASTAAAATPTYCAMGIYSVDVSGNLALLAQCANDTTLFASTFTAYTRALTSSFSKVAGTRYAFGLLIVSATTLPSFFGNNGTSAMASVAPILNGAQTGQSVLPASVTAGNVSGTSPMFFGAVTP